MSSIKNFICISGMSGSGKTTEAIKISEMLGYRLIRPGELARSEWPNRKWGTRLAPEVRMRFLIKEAIKKCGEDTIILDGFPRNIGQLRWLHDTFYCKIEFTDIKTGLFESLKRFLQRRRENDTIRKFLSDAIRYYSLKFYLWISK